MAQCSPENLAWRGLDDACPASAQATDDVLLKEVGELRAENRGIATKIASKLGFVVNSIQSGSGTQAYADVTDVTDAPAVDRAGQRN